MTMHAPMCNDAVSPTPAKLLDHALAVLVDADAAQCCSPASAVAALNSSMRMTTDKKKLQPDMEI
eukprot:7261812-Pyramimonas_sp.AAC.1